MDTGLNCLVAIARFHQLAAEPEQLQHQIGRPGESFTEADMLLAAKKLSLKAKSVKLDLVELKNALLPAIAKHKDGSFFIIAKISNDEIDQKQGRESEAHNELAERAGTVLVHDLREEAPRVITASEFEKYGSVALLY